MSRIRKAVAAVVGSVLMSGLLLLADPGQAAADSPWDRVGLNCSATNLTPAQERRCALDDSPWD